MISAVLLFFKSIKWISLFRNPFVLISIFVITGTTYSFSRINYLKSKVNKLDVVIEQNKDELKECQLINDLNQQEITNILDVNLDLVNQFNDAISDNKKTVKELKEYENLQDNKIKQLLNQIEIDDCSSIYISDSNNELLKKAVNKD